MIRGERTKLIGQCDALIVAYRNGGLGNCELPEDDSPTFAAGETETKLVYFTLPMALNYRRNSTQLWQAAHATYDDTETRNIFSIPQAASLSLDDLRAQLLKYRTAMQPTRHTLTWSTIARTIYKEWGTVTQLLETANYDFLALKELVQTTHRKGLPYLAGPKLFNYWCFILAAKCDVALGNKEFIDIAVDSHVLKCSIKLGVVTPAEASKMSTTAIADRWRERLAGSHIAPTDLNVPLWFWSRNGFALEV